MKLMPVRRPDRQHKLPHEQRLNNGYLNFGSPVAGYLADALDRLVRTELLILGSPSPSGQRQIRVTHAGQARYAQLCQGQRPSHHRSGAR